ncbi:MULTISPECIES: transposase [Lysobacter]|uniref:transposase n=1 Tax=Lysobacter TaxID=68 RepID=UPI00068ED957|nr:MULTISPECIES: transposase [Lysobacter]
MKDESSVEQNVTILNDLEWRRINEALPSNLAARARNQKQKYRGFVEAVLWVACNKAFWSEIPAMYGAWRPIYVRYMRWCKAGVWKVVEKSIGHEKAVVAQALGSLLGQQQYSQQKRSLRSARGVSERVDFDR